MYFMLENLDPKAISIPVEGKNLPWEEYLRHQILDVYRNPKTGEYLVEVGPSGGEQDSDIGYYASENEYLFMVFTPEGDFTGRYEHWRGYRHYAPYILEHKLIRENPPIVFKRENTFGWLEHVTYALKEIIKELKKEEANND